MIKNIALLLTSLFLLLTFGEWLFPKFIEKLPLRLYGWIDKDLRILAQSSKKSLLPNNYIAIVGDSYAVGAGDWLNEIRKKSFLGSPDYSPAHLIHKKTGIDVVSFGQGGAGSFDGIWAEPVNQFLHINSTKDYRLSPPKYFLIFFYEGNDIYDNIGFVDENLQATEEEIKKKIKLNNLDDLLNPEFQKVLNGNFDKNFWKNMLFTRSILQGTLNIVKEWRSSNKNQKEYFSYPVIPVNLALINTKKVPLPMHLQAPPLFGYNAFDKKHQLTYKLLPIGVHVFERALTMLKAFFPQSEIKIVFIPSPLSSYALVSQEVSFVGYKSFPSIVNRTWIKIRHREMCQNIQAVAVAQKLSFINTTNSLREAASREFMHGPIDWDHFNKSGYQVLSDELSELFLHSGGGARIDGCGYEGLLHHQ